MAIAQFAFSKQNQILDTVDVELIDSNAGKAWQHAVMLNASSLRVMRRVGPSAYHPIFDSTETAHQLAEIHYCLQELEFTDFAFVEPVPQDPGQVNQALLNCLHRHFTNSQRIIWAPGYTDFDSQDHVHKIGNRLNEAIHNFEVYIATQQKINWANHGTEIQCRADNALSYDIAPHRHCHSFEHADLVMDGHILGKTLLESFMTDDNPDNWDTTGHVRTNGGCIFLMTNLREQIYQSNEFDDWLQRHNVQRNELHADMPLGMFSPGAKEKMKKLLDLPNFAQIDCKITIDL